MIRALARSHQDLRAGRVFLSRADLNDIDRALGKLREKLRDQRFEDPGLRVASEWLLDNDYLVRRVLGQLRWELPAGFQCSLPLLVGDQRPRALAVAETLLDDGDRELDLDGLERFLGRYQELTPLTIAELWALPALLRLVVVRHIRATLADAVAGSSTAPETPDVGNAAGRAVRTLRLLADIDWGELFCRHNATEALLGEDPAGAYAAMDFETRDLYRRAVEELARSAGRSEVDVSRAVLERARQSSPEASRNHVGYWLIGSGRRALQEQLGARSRSLETRLLERPQTAYFGALAIAQVLLLAPVIGYLQWLRSPISILVVALLLAFIPATVPALTLVHWLFAKLIRPRLLPKLDFSAGIPRPWRTLVAVPTLLGDLEDVDRQVSELEVHYLANPDPELRFALLTDHVDTEQPPGPTHAARLRRAEEGIARLNSRYAQGGSGPFHLLHRESRWNEGERRWMGWERKRGKLEELNRYLRGDRATSYVTHVGDPHGLEDVAFVLTLDSDTGLPPGTAARLAGALAHPLNRPERDDDTGTRRGYAFIQPRVEILPKSARSSPFARSFSGDVGIDIYTRAVSEIYQDLFGAGSYVGKGIYDIDGFQHRLAGRAPENALLSHDLFEGLHGRAALATDIVVYEDYPPHYAAYLHRMHRWVRGDWQLLPWLFRWVPGRAGTRLRNQLGLLDRFKIADNLRRSLLSSALLALLVAGWLLLPGHPAFWTAIALLAPGAAAVWSVIWGGNLPRRELGRWLLALCFAPQEARTVLDAIARVLIRMFWTRTHLLEWTTAARAARTLAGGDRLAYLRRLWVGPGTASVIAWAIVVSRPSALPYAAPVLLLWFLAPEIALRISRPIRASVEAESAASRRMLQRVARRTWLFFESFVGPGDQWLPPDHFQEHPRGVPAHRTSPTNVGLALLSELAAYDLGYLGPLELSSWVQSTLGTLERLERHRGHVYNWYDTRTLAPLEPRYVSTVDSGNLAGALLALAAGCAQVLSDPPLRPVVRRGLLDAAELLAEAVQHWSSASGDNLGETTLELARALVERLGADLETLDVALLRATKAEVDAIEAQLLERLRSGGSLSHDPTLLRELRVWIERLGHQVAEAQRSREQLMPAALGPAPLPLHAIAAACERALPSSDVAQREELERAGSLASTLCARLQDLAARARALVDGMDFRFLYDEDRRLFHVGYNVSAERLDVHHYDLLASEARLASFLAIVQRQVPATHWFALGRPLIRAGRRRPALLSWGGSMFEYLMPRLLMRGQDETLLSQSCEAAVERQIAYGRERGTPWGISESGYAFLDGQHAYQYRSFGVPGLGLRRGLEEDVVITPYASVLALPLQPRAVAANLEALAGLGMLGPFGFYEAADFHPERAPVEGPALVRSYMAHHQGMILIAIDNHVGGDVMVDRFHADPRVHAGELLLDERIPVGAPTEVPLLDSAGTSDTALTPLPALSGWEGDRRSMQVWAIGNGTLTSLMTADGGGGLRWRDIALTRWEPSAVTDEHGDWIFLCDRDSGEVMSATAGPIGDWSDDARVQFAAGSTEFLRRHGELMVRTRVAVVAGEDVEVRQVEVVNHSDRPRRIRVVGCLEPVLEPERDAARHPVFSKLFLRCWPVRDLAGVLISRSTRAGRPSPIMFFRIIADPSSDPRLFEIDRGAFVGRRGSMRHPASLYGRHVGPAAATLDPLCACAADLTLQPGSSRLVTFLTTVAATRAQALELGRRFGSAHAVRWAFEDATRAAARRVVRLGIDPALLPSAQRVLSALLVPDRGMRAPDAVLANGRPCQQRLWGRGISGDEPIILVKMRSGESSALLGEVLSTHRYLRALGLRVDVIVIDDGPSGYSEHDAEVLRRLLAEHDALNMLHQRGGIHVVRTDQASGQELQDLSAAARVYLDAHEGPLARQLELHRTLPGVLPVFEPAGVPPGAPADPEPSLVIPSLTFDNGLGGFDGDEYVIRPGACPPAPWCNVLANERFGCLVSESVLGSSWSLNAGENRLTPWSNDPVGDPPSEVLYLRDEETARVWTTTPRPAGVPTLVRHGHGYSVYESVCAGLSVSMTVFVPPELSLKVVRLRIRNACRRGRRLTATYYAEWALSARRGEPQPYVIPERLERESALLAHAPWNSELAERVAFLATDQALHGCTTDRVELLGRGGDASRPAALRRWGLSGRVAAGCDPCAALQVHLDIGAEEQTEVCFFLGQGNDRQAAVELVRDMRKPGAVEAAWRACRASWEQLLGAVRIQTPDPALNQLCNRWLLYQSLTSRFFGRTGFYQSSGAFGFRDQLQDTLAFVHCAPALARQHLLDAAAHQFVEGDVLHWWHPPGGAGVRTHCSDDLLWLVYVTHDYVEATGDVAVLEERAPFLVGEPLAQTDDARYGRFATGESGTLLEHCRRALMRGFTAGPHGLPLIGDGDWNDGLNRVGRSGTGESVWLAWFVYACTQRFAALLERVGEREDAKRWRARLAPLLGAIAEHGWDGDWYRRAYFDDGTPIGSARSGPPRIDSIVQSWAALSGAGDPERVKRALAAAERMLVSEAQRLVLLLAPPFELGGRDPGYIAEYPAGVRENGGQYTHAAAWLAWAHAACGDGAAAHRIFRLLNPLERTGSAESIERYRVEPYVLAADVYGCEPFIGRGGWTWYTGAAAWTWRLVVEAILGLKRRDGDLELAPCIPPDWDGFEAWVREGQLTVHIVVRNPAHTGHGVTQVYVDGRPAARPRVALTGRGERRVEVWLGSEAETRQLA